MANKKGVTDVDQFKRDIEDIGADPLLVACEIMTGTAPGKSHPYLKKFSVWANSQTTLLNKIALRLNKANLESPNVEIDYALNDVTDMLDKLESFTAFTDKALSEAYISVETRAKVATQMLSFLYAKKQAVTIEDNRDSGLAETLSDDELAATVINGGQEIPPITH